MQSDELFENWYTKDVLEDRFHKRVHYKCSPGLDRIGILSFCDQLQENIEIIQRKVLNGTYNFTKYNELLISKGRNKAPRVISRPTIRDKITLSSLQGYLRESFNDVLDNRLLHTRINDIIKALPSYTHFIKVDIKGFYSSINHEQLLSILDDRLCKTALDLIKKAITTQTVPRDYSHQTISVQIPKGGVPEGLAISNVLADIYLQPIDNYYHNRNDIVYCRYVDDILVLCNNSAFNILKKCILKQFGMLKLEMHPFENTQKMGAGTIEDGFSYLGYQYTLNGVSVKPSTKDRFEHSLENLFSDYAKELENNRNYELFVWRLNLKISGCIHDHKKFGWMFFYSQITDLQLLKHFDWLVDRLFLRYQIPKPERQIKSFFRTYHEIKFNLNTSSYFLNTDHMTIEEMVDIIYDIFHYAVPAKDEDIKKLFFSVFYKNIKELEKDIQFFS